VIGLVTAGLAPMLATQLLPGIPASFAWSAAVLGGASGGLVGAALPTLLAWAPPRARPSVSLVVAVPLLGLWGGFVSGLASLLTCAYLIGPALLCGSLSAMLQSVWLTPLYTWLATSGRTTFPLAVAGPLVGSPIVGAMSAFAVLAGLQLVFASGRLLF
jgi:hypothetical protein